MAISAYSAVGRELSAGQPQHWRQATGQPGEHATVVLADQVVLMHIALGTLLRRNPRYLIAGTARTAVGARKLVRRARPALLICEAEIGDDSGIELCRRAVQVSPGTRVVILTDRNEPLLAKSAVAAGAAGYLLKDTAPDKLVASLDGILAGSVVLDARLDAARTTPAATDQLRYVGFSRREREVLAEMILGLDNKAIAGRLCISEETVKSHVKAVFRKLGARDRTHAVAIALGAALPEERLAARERPGAGGSSPVDGQ